MSNFPPRFSISHRATGHVAIVNGDFFHWKGSETEYLSSEEHQAIISDLKAENERLEQQSNEDDVIRKNLREKLQIATEALELSLKFFENVEKQTVWEKQLIVFPEKDSVKLALQKIKGEKK